MAENCGKNSFPVLLSYGTYWIKNNMSNNFSLLQECIYQTKSFAYWWGAMHIQTDFFWCNTDRIGKVASNNSCIAACVFVATGTCLLSCCPAAVSGYEHRNMCLFCSVSQPPHTRRNTATYMRNTDKDKMQSCSYKPKNAYCSNTRPGRNPKK